MPSRVLDYLSYRHADFVTEEPLPSASLRRSAPMSFAGLSPFDVPEQVELEASRDGACILRFAYPDREAGESQMRPVPGEPATAALLGRRTGKVLQILLSDAQARVAENRLRVDLRPLIRWLSAESPREVQTMNADLVTAITERALSDLRADLLHVWADNSDPRPAGPAAASRAT